MAIETGGIFPTVFRTHFGDIEARPPNSGINGPVVRTKSPKEGGGNELVLTTDSAINLQDHLATLPNFSGNPDELDKYFEDLLADPLVKVAVNLLTFINRQAERATRHESVLMAGVITNPEILALRSHSVETERQEVRSVLARKLGNDLLDLLIKANRRRTAVDLHTGT